MRISPWVFALLLISIQGPVRAQMLHDLVDTVVATSPSAVSVAGKTAWHAIEAWSAGAAFTGVATEVRTGTPDAVVQIRFGGEDVRGEWIPMHVVRSATSDLLIAGYRSDEPIPDSRFEIRVQTGASDIAAFGATGTFDNRSDQDAQPVPVGIEPLAAAQVGSIIPPPLITREQWGAEPFRGTPSSLARPDYEYMTFHHAAGYSAFTLDEGLAQLLAIQDLHQNIRGWSDIGYQFVIDRAGRLYQGRPFITPANTLDDLPVLAMGAHVGGANTGNIGVSLLGCYHPPEGSYCEQEITPEAYDTYVTLFAFLSERYGVDTARIRGHRDFSQTACPGNNNYALLPQIGVDVRQLLLTGNAALGEATVDATTDAEGVVRIELALVSDFGIDRFRLERWLGDDREVLFDAPGPLPTSWSDDGLVRPGTAEYRLYAIAADGRVQRLASLTIDYDVPGTFVLAQTFPNPTAGTVRIRYAVRQDGIVDIGLYDIVGRRVADVAAGFHAAESWHAVSLDTSQMAQGVYHYRIRVEGFSGTIFDTSLPLVVVK